MNKKIKLLLIVIGGGYNAVRDIAKVDFKYTNKMTFGDLAEALTFKKIFDNFEPNDLCFFIESQSRETLIFNLAKKDGYIDWNLNLNEMKLIEIIKYLDQDYIVLYADEPKGCPGAFSLLDNVLNILAGIKILYKIVLFLNKLIKNFVTKNRAYSIITLKSDGSFTKEDIMKFISKSDNWPKGFIYRENSQLKFKVENKIMRDLKYKLINENWISIEKIKSKKEKMHTPEIEGVG